MGFMHYGFRVDAEGLRVDGDGLVRALECEGLEPELGYPGPVPLYLYPVLSDQTTFGSSGWPFTSPAARKVWTHGPGLCPVAEKACRETVVLPWNEGLQTRHVEMIAEAILKVVAAFRV